MKHAFRLNRSHLPILFAIILSTAFIELSMGRLLISKSHHIRLWASTNTPELSQQIADAYSFSHVLHGFIFYAVLRLTLRHRLPFATCLIIAVSVECAWEVIENTDFVIDRYRRDTASLDYHGDTVLNSVCDILFATLGFLLAARLPVWATVTLFLAIELISLLLIRDNLTLNVLMLLHPVQSIKHWQTGSISWPRPVFSARSSGHPDAYIPQTLSSSPRCGMSIDGGRSGRTRTSRWMCPPQLSSSASLTWGLRLKCRPPRSRLPTPLPNLSTVRVKNPRRCSTASRRSSAG